jgi:hypothetical protein
VVVFFCEGWAFEQSAKNIRCQFLFLAKKYDSLGYRFTEATFFGGQGD